VISRTMLEGTRRERSRNSILVVTLIITTGARIAAEVKGEFRLSTDLEDGMFPQSFKGSGGWRGSNGSGSAIAKLIKPL